MSPIPGGVKGAPPAVSGAGNPAVARMPARPRLALRPTGPAEKVTREMAPALARLAQQMRQVAMAEQGAIVLLAGCGKGTGVSSLALALAWVAANDHSVLLVDANLGNVGLSRLPGQPIRHGWEEAIRGRGSFDEAIHGVEHSERLAFLPLKRSVADVEALRAGKTMHEAAAELRGVYDLTLVDGGSVHDGEPLWAPLADTSVLVCETRRSPTQQWARGWDRLEASCPHVLGVVETCVSFPDYRS